MILIKKLSFFVAYSSNRCACTYYVVPLLNPPILIVIWANITQVHPDDMDSEIFLFLWRPWQECFTLLIGGGLRSRRGFCWGWVQLIRVTTTIGTMYTTSTSTLYNADCPYAEERPDTTHWMSHVGPMTSSWNGRQVKHPHNTDCWTTHNPRAEVALFWLGRADTQ